MDELDRLLAQTLHGAAERAPSDSGLLSGVHGRARRYRRRRIATTLAAGAAVLAIGVPAAVVLGTRPDASAPPPLEAVPTQSASVASPSPAASAPASTSAPASSPPALSLVPGYTAPTFPYTLPATDGMKAPVASMDSGNLVAFFEAIDIRHHSDTTVTVSSRKPAFTGAATEAPQTVRGHGGTLRTVDVKPAKQLILYWPESTTRWIALATDDTYTPQQVVALANALTPASIPVAPPFTLDLSPSGLATDTVSESTIGFGAGFRVVLYKRRALTAANQTVGSYKAQLTRDAHGVTLDVDVTDWSATLRVSVAAGRTISDADLLRFAAGVHILNRSNPADW
ncbi:hypothetical protein Dvina_41140 [Dactylosporangium vinaceum]|uniref:Uncharacterized protein n=1 Tax=Dactylosporangium vinaceum TaxID=53362 RepID=A0ABV5MP27_9ACTN|nr:hypothetical protein [Dactylosporangium vinaceum]UAB94487.1 hypothetical protein Dvina_41140 [Dactylosporangium vinaceum]